MRQIPLKAILAAAALCAAGCTSVATFDYEGARGTMIRATTMGISRSKNASSILNSGARTLSMANFLI